MIGASTDDGHESAAFIEIETCRIALACVYAHAVEAVQGRTAWSRRTATSRSPQASSRRGDIRENNAALPAVAEHYPKFRDRRAADGRALPWYVEDEFEAYLECGLLKHGFLWVK